MNTRTVLGDIEEQQHRIDEMGRYLTASVRQARLTGSSWVQIGAALGVSKQTAFARYSAACVPEASAELPGQTGLDL